MWDPFPQRKCRKYGGYGGVECTTTETAMAMDPLMLVASLHVFKFLFFTVQCGDGVGVFGDFAFNEQKKWRQSAY